MRRLLAGVVLLALLGCAGPTASPIQMTDPRASAGAPKSCAELGFSDVRCTFMTLRAAQALERAHPDADVASRQFHEAGTPPAGHSPLPTSQVVAAVVVFTLDDGSRIGIAILCPREPSGADQVCDPRIN